jgi:hypothetical protein
MSTYFVSVCRGKSKSTYLALWCVLLLVLVYAWHLLVYAGSLKALLREP